ncbi:alpha/beta hydrolase [uncultured Treponema sp.]|uniref:alpha/beta hydrolase n=1 Tax=uncultured Treponema sp. TaxID=162155 RepID=UPI002598FCD2|nr:alpha/beta hydrolase [uncultured Treponema sp.]
MKKTLFFLLIFTAETMLSAKSGKPIRIWEDVPSMKKTKTVMYMHEPDKNAGNRNAAVIICPGGSYHHLGLYNEGYKTAEWFSSKGVMSFTLRYRTAEGGNHYPAMLEDLQRAIQIVRERASEYEIDPGKVGIIGYSAGGHLVTMGGAFYQSHNELKKLGIETEVSLRPDFVIPVYPVVSMQDSIAHKWSRKSLLGKNQTQERKDEFSMEMQIPSDMPPTYVVVCRDDNVVDYKNSLELYKALENQNINAHLELYEWGKHGFGMLNNSFMKSFHWNDTLWNWLIQNNLL